MSMAHETGDSTRNFARVLGPYLVILAVVVAARAPDMSGLLSEFTASSVWPFVMGAFALLGGLAIVAFHQVWRGAAAIIVSALGWLLVVRGVVLLAFPTVLTNVGDWFIDATAVWVGAYVVMALLGLYLTWVGYGTGRKQQPRNDRTADQGVSHAA